MVVDTHKFSHMMSYRPEITGAKYLKSGFHSHVQVASHLPISIRARADFMIPDMAKGGFVVVEAKKGVGRVGARQMPSYLRMPVIAGEYHALRPEIGVYPGVIFEREGIKTLPELAKVARPIDISYPNQALVETLLGTKGKRVLGRVFSVLNSLARDKDWPLDTVEVRYVRDPEVENWEYVLLLLVFTCDFDTADMHLHELYDQIDMLTGRLTGEEHEILQRMIFFDVETRASIPSA